MAERAEKEALAQRTIIRALKPFDRDTRDRVLVAATYIIAADRLVDGILDAALATVEGRKRERGKPQPVKKD